MTQTRFARLSNHEIRTEIRAMEHELRLRAEPKWTGRTHEWSTAEHPLAKQCTRCHVPMVPWSGDSNWRNGKNLAALETREDCPR